MTKICLCSIMRNESKIVKRQLDSIKKVVDYISICDTGSEDNTVELIKEWGKENDVPTAVHFEPFQNFGYNRTLSFQMAKKSFPDADYCLFLDADMILKIEPGWKKVKDKLTLGSYTIKQTNPRIAYYNLRLASTKYDFECIGVTHEYWSGGEGCEGGILEELWIDDRDDGGHKANKLTRDKDLLISGLEDPNTPEDLKGRYEHYLAQTYRGLGQFPKAIAHYNRRIEIGGWVEEVFQSALAISRMYRDMKNYPMFILFALRAWQIRPPRVEPLLDLATYFRESQEYFLACMFANQAKEYPYPTEDRLFVEKECWEWKIDFELSVSCYYVPQYRFKGWKASKRLLENSNIPENVLHTVKNNMKFYEPHEEKFKLMKDDSPRAAINIKIPREVSNKEEIVKLISKSLQELVPKGSSANVSGVVEKCKNISSIHAKYTVDTKALEDKVKETGDDQTKELLAEMMRSHKELNGKILDLFNEVKKVSG